MFNSFFHIFQQPASQITTIPPLKTSKINGQDLIFTHQRRFIGQDQVEGFRKAGDLDPKKPNPDGDPWGEAGIFYLRLMGLIYGKYTVPVPWIRHGKWRDWMGLGTPINGTKSRYK